MTVRFDPRWTYQGFEALILENDQLRFVVLPDFGGRIWSIVDKARDREMLWHHPRMPLRPPVHGATYDNWFAGGWDELFPNDAPVVIDGEAYPDHGEVWSLRADWELVDCSAAAVSIRFTLHGFVTASRYEKTLTLNDGEATLRLRYRLTNVGPTPLDFVWKLHAPLPVHPGARLHLPARTVLVDPAFAGAFGSASFAWPYAPREDGGVSDLRDIPEPDAGRLHFYYGLDLTAGWAAVTYPDEDVGFGLAFDPAILQTVWIFATFNGWRGLSTLILEPCTGYPYELDKAIAAGTATRLEAGATLETDVVAAIIGGHHDVAAISRDGDVT